MQVDAILAARQQDALDVVRQHLGWRAAGITGKGPVEVAAIDGRDASAGHHGREVGGRQHEQPPVERRGIERAHELHQRDLPLVFVAMVARHQEHAWPLAARGDGDGNGNPAVRRLVSRVRQLQVAMAQAGRIEIDRG